MRRSLKSLEISSQGLWLIRTSQALTLCLLICMTGCARERQVVRIDDAYQLKAAPDGENFLIPPLLLEQLYNDALDCERDLFDCEQDKED